MISIADVRRARSVIRNEIYRTPIVRNETLDERLGGEVFFKLENLQKTGAFKIRGVLNRMNALSAVEREKGIICASSGSFGFAVAYVSRRRGLKATIVLPECTPGYKIERIGHYAPVVVEGATYHESSLIARRKAKEEELTFLHPFDDSFIMAGQGTVGLEILEDVTGIDILIAPIGGGGLIAGLLTVFKELSPETVVVGIEAQGAACMYESWKQGRIVELPHVDTIAEGIAVKKPGHLTFEVVRKHGDDIVLVPDGEIRDAVRFLFEDVKVVAECAAAAPLAALLSGKVNARGKKTVCVVSGGNIAPEQLAALL